MSDLNENIRIKIHSELYEVDASLFSNETIDFDNLPVSEENPDPEIMDINSLGKYEDDGERISISYQESEFFHVEWMIVPLDEGSRMMVSYYFYPAEAE